MDIKGSINDTRKGFEESFAAGKFYNRQTQDPDHLEKILGFVKISERMKILDLGTGSGYLLFPIAKGNPGCDVIGLDIVNDALEANRMRATAEGIKNLSFVSYDGIDFPFESDSFDLVVTRYALHHFPDIVHSIGEVSRVLKNGGMLFISDPCPNECDTDRFVDDYMRLKKDGHIKFYTKDDWTDICCNQGLISVPWTVQEILERRGSLFDAHILCMKENEMQNFLDAVDLAENSVSIICLANFTPAYHPYNINFFSLTDCTARVFWQQFPIKKKKESILIIGFGVAGKVILDRALELNVIYEDQAISYHIFGDGS